MIDTVMETCVSNKPMFWGNLSEEEGDELTWLYGRRKAWYDAWDLVRISHEELGIPYEGPTAWMSEIQLITIEYLQRKGWRCTFEDQKQIRSEDKHAAADLRALVPIRD